MAEDGARRDGSLPRDVARNSQLNDTEKRASPYIQTEHPNNPIERDHLGRAHYKRPMSGKANLIVRTAKHHNLSVTSHCGDIKPRLQQDVEEGKTVALLSVDGGPDLSVKHQANIYQYGLLWKECLLQSLIVFDYGPNQSALNPIERIWSPVTKTLSGVIFHDRVRINSNDPNKPPTFEELAPCKQSDLTPSELDEKEKKVFNTAMEECCELISRHAVYAGDSVLCHAVECFSIEEKSDKDTYESMLNFTKAPLYKLHEKENKKHLAEYSFVCKHLVRQHNVVTFVICKSDKCSHCRQFVDVSEATKCIQNYGYRLPNPEASATHKGHFMSFIQLEAKYKGKHSLPRLDRHQPSQENHGVCSMKGCRGFRYFSDHDEDRHLKLLHGGKRAIADAALPPGKDNPKIGTCKAPANLTCQFPNCGIKFSTAYALNQHKKKENHKTERGRKKTKNVEH